MASPEAAAGTSNKLKVGRTTEYRMGANTELLSITGDGGGSNGEGTKLFLLCGADRFESVRPFRSGEFSVHMVRVKGRPISLVTCMVDDHRWMLAKDAIAGRVEARMFVFGLPGFFYGLELPGTGDGIEEKLKMLEEIFASFSAYRDLTIEQPPATWRNPAVAAIAATAAAAKSSTAEPELVQLAVRSSAAVKILARSLLAGAIQPAKHLLLHGGGPAAALPTMSAVAALLTAIETGQIPSAATAAASGAEPDVGGGGGGGGVGWWYVNGDGMALLLRVMRFARADSAVPAVAVAVAAAERERKRPRQHEDEGKGGGGLKGGDGGGGGLKGANGSVGQMWCGRGSAAADANLNTGTF
uniref:Uncharacterized protein n=1 Tax=Ananas comosus var. bracteatus TaxID=296719 RepID=A0A6V7P323_ANACO|nr:unnamed protein product [Ananas comosus var. bracteatus]